MSEALLNPPAGPVAAFSKLAAASGTGGPDWLAPHRTEALARFAEQGFPHTKVEEWRQTSLRATFDHEYVTAPQLDDAAAKALLDDAAYADLGLHRLVFVNGRFAPALSSDAALAGGVYAGTLGGADGERERIARKAFGSVAPWRDQHFGALNGAGFGDVAFVHAPAGAKLETAIHIVNLTSAPEGPVAVFPRLLVVAEEGSELYVVQTHAGREGERYLSAPLAEFVTGEGAEVHHTRIQAESESAAHAGVQGLRVEAKGNFIDRNVALGAELARLDAWATIAGEEAHAQLDGLYMPHGKQHVDNYTIIDHAVPNCTSSETYKGVLADAGRAVFTGRIIVREDAQKTDARQQNDNLLLSDTALANTRPQLEIYADDVKCAHGATLGRLDEEALFYLRSRGIDAPRAKELMILAFAGSVLDSIQVPGLREKLVAEIAERLPHGDAA